jgi:hypothetical protein
VSVKRLQLIATICQILSFPTGAYCAYAAYVAIHQPKLGQGATVLSPTWLSICFGAFATCLIVMFIAWLVPMVKRTEVTPASLPSGRRVKAITLHCRAEEAEYLAQFLEEVWHFYDAQRGGYGNGEPLLYPLKASSIPDEIKEEKYKQLLEFRLLYRRHFDSLKKTDPDFHSSVADGLPSEVEYLTLLRNLKEHARLLRERADSLLHLLSS